MNVRAARSTGLCFRATTDNFLPRGIVQRVFLVVLALPLGALSVAMLWFILPQVAHARDWKALAIGVAITECLGALTVVTGLALTWAFFKPPWIEQPARRFSNRLVWWFFVLQVLPFLLMVI